LTKEEQLGLDKNRRKFDIKEEYFVGPSQTFPEAIVLTER